MTWLLENAATLIISALLLVGVFFAARYVWKKARAGQCVGCSGCNGACGSSGCHCSDGEPGADHQ